MLDGSQGDFLAIVRDARDYRQHCIEQNVTGARIKKVDRETARKVWNREMRRLNALTKRDPSFERQVHSVAAALMEKGRLTGDEVKQIMASSGVEQSEAFDGGHVEVVILNKGQGE